MTIFQTENVSIIGYRKGREETFRRIYKHYVNGVERFISSGWYNPKTGTRTRGVRDFETGAELIQEVFIRAFSEKARNSYDGIRPFRSFLFTIARNVIIDHIRKIPTDVIGHHWIEMDDNRIDIHCAMKAELEIEEEPPDEIVHRKRCLSATQSFVAELDETRRLFVQLRLADELSQKEVAHSLGLSRAKIRTMEGQLQRELTAHLKNMELI